MNKPINLINLFHGTYLLNRVLQQVVSSMDLCELDFEFRQSLCV